ncbi:hypothetical protein BYT27DRAFT_7201093 [Phlegmacium glaucopus]|nr:hypothetical protein BYT27DRAFT_7201093 [Phlegmacium glaucopus]
MTELELVRNNVPRNLNRQWGFGQILPLVLTISPLFSLYESILARRSSGPASKCRKLRISIRSAKGLQRPHCELDGLPPYSLQNIPEEEVTAIRAPSSFAVVTIDEREMYTTFEQEDTTDPDWRESFDVDIGDLSTVVIRVFDRKCIDRNWPAFIGFTTILPFSLLPPPKEQDLNTSSSPNSHVDIDDIPLVRGGITVSDMSVSISLSTNTSVPPTLPYVPPHLYGPQETHVKKRVALFKCRNKTWGQKKVTTTRVYQLDA